MGMTKALRDVCKHLEGQSAEGVSVQLVNVLNDIKASAAKGDMEAVQSLLPMLEGGLYLIQDKIRAAKRLIYIS